MQMVDVIIPVYKPKDRLFMLLDRLAKQSVSIHKIILINTEKSFFDAFLSGRSLVEMYPNVEVFHIKKEEFDHGKTRGFGVTHSEAPYFVMMTDDAIPADEKLIENLLKPLESGEAAMSYARQLPNEDCGIIETYTRGFNYPEQSAVHKKEDLQSLGIKTFFASNVCACYCRAVFDELGGFTGKTIFNEDMIYARGLINAGYSICYAADAKVIHSHNYSGIQQFRRNFDLGVSHAQYPNIFGDVKAEGEGMKLVKQTVGYLFSIKKPWLIVKLVWQSGCKYLGYRFGKKYAKLPLKLVKRLSMNATYWK